MERSARPDPSARPSCQDDLRLELVAKVRPSIRKSRQGLPPCLLLRHSSVQVRVLGLETIILSKEQANRGDKDRATLPILRRTLRLKQEGRGEG